MKRFYLAASCLLVASVMGAYPMGAPKLHSPQEATGVDNEVIYEAPEGESKNYSENYSGWLFWGSDFGLYYSADNKAYNEIVWTSDSKVYIFDPVKTSPTNSYAVGTYADGKITVQLPQCIGEYTDENGDTGYMYLNKMEEVEQDGEKYYMICYPEDNYLVYDVEENGNIILNLGNDKDAVDTENGVNPKYLVGITYENEPHSLNVWSGFGDAFEEWSLVPDEDPVTPPAGLTSEYWAFDTLGTKSLIEVKINGSDIYINGFTSYIKDFWIKGTLTEGKDIIIPTQQYMGKNEYGQSYYFLATKTVIPDNPNDWNTYEMIDRITMNYDPETKIYSAPGECLCVSNYRDYVAYYALAENPMLWKQNPESLNAAPNNPSVESYTPFNEDTIQGSIVWKIPNTNVNGALLRTDRMYYNMYVNGELFTFETWEYPLFTEPTTNVPYDAGNFYNIWAYGESHTISFYFDDAESFGLQSFYIGDGDVVYKSELVTVDASTLGVKATGFEKEVKEVVYYNLSGNEVTHPVNGIYIKRVVYTDGSHHTEKIVLN